MKIRVIFVSVLVVIVGVVGYFLKPIKNDAPSDFEKTDYESIDLEGIDKLMIVAHPDDDILWGGSELINDDYLVVCVTCGSDAKRVREFETVMTETNDKYVMLGYPDKTNGERDNWDDWKDDIIEDIEKIYALKDWEKIVTHNPEGEYGHIHHKMTDEIVTGVVDNKDKLYYFGKYYSKGDLEENDIELVLLDDETLAKKEEILDLYTSQDKTIHETFGHMIKTENVMSYKEWNELYETEKEENR